MIIRKSFADIMIPPEQFEEAIQAVEEFLKRDEGDDEGEEELGFGPWPIER